MSVCHISKGVARGVAMAPPSKSYAHRLLLAAFLSGRRVVIGNVDLSNDILATIDCITALGAKVNVEGDVVTVEPGATTSSPLPCRESGSTLRFMIPVALVLNGKACLTGTPKLISRGIGEYERIFKDQNISYTINSDSIEAEGHLNGGLFHIDGSISSQFVTGLLFALPLLEEDQRFDLPDCTVEGDWSNAAFLDIFNQIGGDVTLLGLKPNSLQGDKIYRRHFDALNRGWCEIDLGNCIDLGPVLCTMAAINHGARFTNTARLRIKESDRIADIVTELEKTGAGAIVGDNSVEIRPVPQQRRASLEKENITFDSHNDHRLSMCLTDLATLFGDELNGCESVSKSYP